MKKLKTLFFCLMAAMLGVACGDDGDKTIAVSNVVLDKTTLELEKGETGQLIATVTPDNANDKSILWSSDNVDIVTVDDTGLVTAKAIGKAIITAKVGDKNAACAVTVKNEFITNTALIEFIERKTSIIFTKDNNGYVNAEANKDAIESITTLKLNNSSHDLSVTSLDGIHFFTSLTRLECNYLPMTTLDVSTLNKLESLTCSNNSYLSELKLPDNTDKLNSLYVPECALTSLKDISAYTELQTLYCISNKLTELDLSSNKKLKLVYCSVNPQLSKLKLPDSNALTTLQCHKCAIAELDVSAYKNLETLTCNTNEMTSLNVTGLTKLRMLHCNINNLQTLDVSTLTGLEQIYCHMNQLSSLDLSNCPLKKTIYIGNQIDGKGGDRTLSAILPTAIQSYWETWKDYNDNTNASFK